MAKRANQSLKPTVRLAEPHDAEVIAATLRAAFAEFQQLYTPAAFRATTPGAKQIAERFAEGPIWIAELAGKAVGTVAAVPRSLELYIRSMFFRQPEGSASVPGFWRRSRSSLPTISIADYCSTLPPFC